MRKPNYPPLSLPPCQLDLLSLGEALVNGGEVVGSSIELRKRLGRVRLASTNRPTDYRLKVTRLSDEILVYDDLRQLWLPLTPEEWVRQHFVAHLIRDLGYPPSLMMNEVPLALGTLDKRIDTVVYSRNQSLGDTPAMLMLIEYKAPQVKLSSKVLEQAERYNYATRTPYIVISNGMEHQVYLLDYATQRHTPLCQIPYYKDIKHL